MPALVELGEHPGRGDLPLGVSDRGYSGCNQRERKCDECKFPHGRSPLPRPRLRERRTTMRKLALVALTLALITPGVAPVAHAEGQVTATWMLTELHQGGHGGGPLFADGTAGGRLAISTQNGQFRGMFLPTTWSWLIEGSV